VPVAFPQGQNNSGSGDAVNRLEPPGNPGMVDGSCHRSAMPLGLAFGHDSGSGWPHRGVA
jgi:hypothetical protein